VLGGLCLPVFFYFGRRELVDLVCSLGAPLRAAKGAPVVPPLGLSVVDVWAFWGRIVGLSLCWVVCWYGGGLICVWVSIWVMLPVGETRFHPRVWMFCAHCFFCGIGGIERDRERLWSYVRSIVL